MNRRKLALLALASLATVPGTMIASDARGEILATRTRTDASVYGGATYLVDWNGGAAGGTTVGFSTSAANTKVIVMFNAECAVEGSPSKYVDIDLVVDPAGPTGEIIIPPSNGDNAFCSGNGTSTGSPFTLDGWVSAALIGVVTLPQAGAHTLKVRVNGLSSVTRLDDMSLVVMR